MKIAILTLPLHVNYGGILQAYALQTVLERMGHDVEIIKWAQKEFRGHPFYKAPFIYAKRLLLGKELRIEHRLQHEKKIVYQHLQESINRLIHYTNRTIGSKGELITYCDKAEFNALIVGSDQVWRKSYGSKSFFNRFFPEKSFPSLETFFLDFVDELHAKPIMIAYAASFGVEYPEYSSEESACLGRLIAQFNAVSVRERQGVQLIKDVYQWKVDTCHVLDPTMLLKKEDYSHLFVDLHKKKPYLLYYVLDDNREKQSVSDALSVRKSLHVVKISPNRDEGALQERILPSVEEWLSLFANADFVLTDSFHGMVFSIIFNKPFFVMGNAKRGMSRFKSLLSQLNLEERQIDSFKLSMEQTINWHMVNRDVEIERARSKSVFNKMVQKNVENQINN